MTVWAALASPRYLISPWPWRSYAYLLTSVPMGAVSIVVLVGLAALSALLSPILIGILMLTAFPLIGAAIGWVERRRAGMMLVDGIKSPHAKLPAGLTRRAKLTFRRREQASMRALGYGFVLGVFVWPLSALFAGLSVTILLTTLASPVIADGDQMGMGPWTMDTAGEGLLFLVLFGPPYYVISSYLLGVIAGAEASLARAMLGPRQEELQRNLAELRRSRLDLVDAFETERVRIERHLHDGVQQRLVGLTMTLGLAELDLPEGEGSAVGGEGARRGGGRAGGSAGRRTGHSSARAGGSRTGGSCPRSGGPDAAAGDHGTVGPDPAARADRGSGVLRRQ
ncbi:sensor histidine kinase [Kribbella speibonae]|uniref:sensor histidine kinase n=1 Tax=Kribbella speibonae TaxID=1572660 RepID=UPI001EDDCB28|nr:sensor domain-containing protein [Kribbella speibonae]